MGTVIALSVEHTLVTHPVGFHFDTFFHHGSDVIENKICLWNFQKSDKTFPYAKGRGGYGPGNYVFAILDRGRGLS